MTLFAHSRNQERSLRRLPLEPLDPIERDLNRTAGVALVAGALVLLVGVLLAGGVL